MQNQFTAAINQICDEKRIDPATVITALEQAMVAAYRRDYGHEGEEYEGKMDDTGNVNISRVYHVVEEIIDPADILEERRIAAEAAEAEAAAKAAEAAEAGEDTEGEESAEELEEELLEAAADDESEQEEEEELLSLEAQILLDDAKKMDANAQIGSTVSVDVTPATYGRIAAQTAKQVIMQRVREAERDATYQLYKDKEGEILNAIVSRVEANGDVFLDVDKNHIVLQRRNQISGEHFTNGQRTKVIVSHVERTNRGSEIVISRTTPNLVLRLLEMEVPEIVEGSVEVVGVAREAGIRTKIAVRAQENGVDPVGSCVGQKGIRIQNITDELNDERIDIIQYEEDIIKYLINTLSPAKIISIELDEDDKRAKVYVTEDQRSLAIGKRGQNVRLASKLIGWEIDILDWEGGDAKGTLIADQEELEDMAPIATEAAEEVVEEISEEATEEVAEEVTEEPAAEAEVEEVTEEATEEVSEEVVEEEVAEETEEQKAE